MRFDAVIFDMDGVLVDSEALHDRAFCDVFRDLGYPGETHGLDFSEHLGRSEAPGQVPGHGGTPGSRVGNDQAQPRHLSRFSLPKGIRMRPGPGRGRNAEKGYERCGPRSGQSAGNTGCGW